MTYQPPGHWMWDFWFAQNGLDYHLFYLKAPRALGDPELRHWNVRIGHAVSRDLVRWQDLPDAIGPSTKIGAWDDYTTWTGSIIHHAGTWYMFYTGAKRAEKGLIQRIGLATSKDLITWQKHPDNPVLTADPNWYETLNLDLWHDEAWRDPFIFRHEGLFHAFITARTKIGHKSGRGVIGHAVSNDLLNWQVLPPISEPGEFGYLEVPQLVEISGRWYLFFSVTHDKYSEVRLARPGIKRSSGTHYFVADRALGPFTYLSDDFMVGDEIGSLYSGKVIRNPKGEWVFMAFKLFAPGNRFIGELCDPIPIILKPDGRMTVSI